MSAVEKAHRHKSKKATKALKSVGHMQKCSSTICLLEIEMRWWWRFDAKGKLMAMIFKMLLMLMSLMFKMRMRLDHTAGCYSSCSNSPTSKPHTGCRYNTCIWMIIWLMLNIVIKLCSKCNHPVDSQAEQFSSPARSLLSSQHWHELKILTCMVITITIISSRWLSSGWLTCRWPGSECWRNPSSCLDCSEISIRRTCSCKPGGPGCKWLFDLQIWILFTWQVQGVQAVHVSGQ